MKTTKKVGKLTETGKVTIKQVKGRYDNRMRIESGNIVLRDMIESDIEDYVKWFTTEDEWTNWDAPWEWEEEPVDEDSERETWVKYCERIKMLKDEEERWKFEIDVDGKHVGWVSSYTDLDYVDNRENYRAIGICVIPTDSRSKGTGTKALGMFIDYYRQRGHKVLYTQTWSGNYRMVGLAGKLNFKEYYRAKDLRTVRGEKYDAITWKLEL